MKASKIRKMKRDMAKAHNVKRNEIARITVAQERAWANYNLFKNWYK